MQPAESINFERVWQAVLGELEVVLSRPNFITWFRHTFIVGLDGETMIIGVPNSFTVEWLTNKFQPDILRVLGKLLPDFTIKAIACKITQPAREQKRPTVLRPEQTKDNTVGAALPLGALTDEAHINPRYTFKHFIVGNHNRLAHAASLAVSSEPGKHHNPLFVYGGVGLGKTHLIHAIGNEVRRKYPKQRVLYAPCERFANEFIAAIQTKKTDDFKQRYRKVDILLIDDIQFLSGKEGTQEEFFHTFNALHQTGRQIVLTSDRVPQAIPELEARLSSRFVWGMVTDIKNPDLETRVAILKQKCAERNAQIPDETIELVARTFQENIRELEGGLNQILAYCELERIEPTPKEIEKFLAQHQPQRRLVLTPTQVMSAVAAFYQIPVEELTGPRRHKEFVHPRQVMMYLMHFELGYSYPKIGRELTKDHTTVMHGAGKIEHELTRNAVLQQEITLLKDQLRHPV